MVTNRRNRRRKRCKYCRRLFTPTTRKQVYCSTAHRVADYRKRREFTLQQYFDGVVAETNLGRLARSWGTR